jgi:hypothetical protein
VNFQIIIKEQLAKCDQSDWQYLESTGWLDEASDEIIYSHHLAFTESAKVVTKKIAYLVGPPSYLSNDTNYFDSWYPEAFYAAGWEIGDKILFVAAEHHDRETPISLLVGALQISRINELKA